MVALAELEQAAAASDGLYLHGIASKPLMPASLLEAAGLQSCPPGRQPAWRPLIALEI